MDLGESLNPAIDIGQIEGGVMQGYGLSVLEQLIHSPSGALLTKGREIILSGSIGFMEVVYLVFLNSF